MRKATVPFGKTVRSKLQGSCGFFFFFLFTVIGSSREASKPMAL